MVLIGKHKQSTGKLIEKNQLNNRLFNIYESQLLGTGERLREDIAQDLFGIRISLQRYILSHGHEENLIPIKEMIDEVARKLSEVANELSPSILANIGFVQAVDDLVYHRFRPAGDIKCRIDRRIRSKTFDFQLNCYRILQDLFGNLPHYPTLDQLYLRLVIKDRLVLICLDGFLSLHSEQMETEQIDNELFSLLKSRAELYLGSVELKQKKAHSQLIIKMYSEPL